MKTYLEDVFKKSGIPTYTFVKPIEYNKIIVSLRTKGRGIIIEGPSGIGKTTSIQKAIEELSLNKNVLKLSGRKAYDRDLIKELPEMGDIGTVIIDDFHVLIAEAKLSIANYMKILADEESGYSKLILIGINKAGDSLVQLASDLNNRIDTVRFEKNPDEKVMQVIEQGEIALNILFNTKKEIVELSKGSFHIAQYLCNEICTFEGILERSDNKRIIETSLEIIKQKVLDEFGRTFYSKARSFATGTRLRREGRAPYLHLLYWLSLSDDWTIQIDDISREHPEHKLSILQVADKGHLEGVIKDDESIQEVIHFDSHSRVLSIEDPKFMFYLRNLLWSKFARQIGYLTFEIKSRYDFALSFAGEDRNLADEINKILLENDIAVFYDKNEQSRILGESVEDYLAPIYSSEARFIVALLSMNYPRKIWTKFESDNFKQRFGENSVIPIWYSNCPITMFDESRKYGGITFDVNVDIHSQATLICSELIEKIYIERQLESEKLES
ncbi:TIR domain-containing protein [Compostibacter hankyongensis]|uniref:AAA+ ATPase domain-containing protein n=1 Tax=Compostibacter hankyongensis TaxID=1007089 RepID=A0ABP8FB87_9BACT